MKTLTTGFFLFFVLLSGTAQEKPPVIGDDYATLRAGDTITVNLMENDWCMEGHTMKIMNLTQGDGGMCVWADSSVTYSSFYFFSGIDTVRYRLVDMTNGLFSEMGNFIITVQNDGRKRLDVNNIDAAFHSFGFQFCTLPGYQPDFIVPKGSGRRSIFSYSLWMGGMDEGGQLHLAAERYRMNGADYFPGPFSGTWLNAQFIDWNLVSRVSREEIEYHRAHWWEAGYQPIESIANWSAHGDATLGQAAYLAPFFDHNGDDDYDPHQGDVPYIRGDLALWNVYNDGLAPHGDSGGEEVGAEIQMMAYAFDCPEDSIFNNTLFIRYDIINRSFNAYHDFYLTAFNDFDLGYPWDDFVGCDTLLDCFFVFNGDNDDETDNVFGNTLGYGIAPPAQGVVFLNQSMSSFMATTNYNNLTSDPTVPAEYYNVMNGLWRGGQPITYGGTGFGGEEPVKYQFPGDPSNPDEWSELSAGNNPDDRRGMGATGPFDFLPGDTLKLDLAFVFARDYEGDHLGSVALLKERIGMLRWYYQNDSTPCGKTWSSVQNQQQANTQLRVFPNPATDFIQVEMKDRANQTLDVRISDLSGRRVIMDKWEDQKVLIPVSGLAKGLYLIEISAGRDVFNGKFIKK